MNRAAARIRRAANEHRDAALLKSPFLQLPENRYCARISPVTASLPAAQNPKRSSRPPPARRNKTSSIPLPISLVAQARQSFGAGLSGRWNRRSRMHADRIPGPLLQTERWLRRSQRRLRLRSACPQNIEAPPRYERALRQRAPGAWSASIHGADAPAPSRLPVFHISISGNNTSTE
jgi:hypothetical protein